MSAEDVAGLAGAAALLYGVRLYSVPAMWVTAGVLLLALALVGAWRKG